MTKEYVAYLAYRKGRKPSVIQKDPVYEDFLMHYGVKGQKWGHRQWQNADGSYTEAGKHHYGWGYGRQNTGGSGTISRRRTGVSGQFMANGYRQARMRTGTRTTANQTQKSQTSAADIEARKARTRRILGIAAGVAVAAALSYAAYKGSTKLRDNMRSDVLQKMNTSHDRINTLNSKYWSSADRKKYSELSAQRAKDMADNITRRDAVASKFAEKTGLQISMPQSRKRVMAQRQSENRYANFIRDAESRGAMNKSIHDARAELKAAQKKLTTYKNTQHVGTSKQYEALWTQRHTESVEAARKRLNNLLQQRRAG